MDISLNWIKDFIEVPDLSADELGVMFTLHTAEVEGVKERGKGFEDILIAEVKEAEKHPEADKLSICKVDAGSGGLIDVVCGAPNVRAGLKVAYAPVGFTMPNGITLDARKIRGIVSNGMLCSQAELELGDNHEGIWELPEDSKVGQSLVEAFPAVQDIIFDVDNKSLTHRPDLWGHIGLAREWAAAQRKKLKYPFTPEWLKSYQSKCTDEESPVKIKVEEGTASLGYFGLSVSNVSVGESPLWMQLRLLSAGLRPINSIVDISNYVMLETGMPNHIFDKDRIRGGEVIIRKAQDGEELEMLDDSVVKLDERDTVVADKEGALVVGGVMGGKYSGVSDDTEGIFIECANWMPARIRRTSNRIGLRTDSSQRYEKSLDSNLLERTVFRILELVTELCPEAKVIGKLEFDGPEVKEHRSVVTTSYKRICNLLGKDISSEEIRTILECLDFKVQEESDSIVVTAPTYRSTKDVECEYCIVEEVGKMIGYDNIEPVSPYFQVKPVRLSSQKSYQRKIQDFLSLNMPAFEVMTYPLVGEEFLKKADWKNLNEKLILGNPMSDENDRMRPALMPNLLDISALNAKTYSSFKAFEVGRVYQPHAEKEIFEPNHLGIVSYSKSENGLIINVLDAIEKLASYIGVDLVVRDWEKQENSVMPADWKGWHPYQSAVIELDGTVIGGVTKVNPVLLSEYKLKGELVIAEIDMSTFDGDLKTDIHSYSPFGRYPSSDFDCTVTTDMKVAAGKAADAVKAAGLDYLDSVKIVTIYKMEDSKAITLKSSFSAADRTLTPEEIKVAEQGVMASLEKAGFPLRQ